MSVIFFLGGEPLLPKRDFFGGGPLLPERGGQTFSLSPPPAETAGHKIVILDFDRKSTI